MIPFTNRRAWIVNELRAVRGADIRNAEFVAGYVLYTGAKYHVCAYGAHKCPQLGRDLRKLYKLGVLRRRRASVHGMGGMGFPTWVWFYEVSR